MNKKTKIILAAAGLLVLSGAVIIYSQDAKRKKYMRTIVPPEYALSLINKKQ